MIRIADDIERTGRGQLIAKRALNVGGRCNRQRPIGGDGASELVEQRAEAVDDLRRILDRGTILAGADRIVAGSASGALATR